MMLTNLLKSLDGYKVIRKGEDFILEKMKNKQEPPRSWEEFCENYPFTDDCFIGIDSSIKSAKDTRVVGECRHVIKDVNWINSKEEAEAIVALMQLRQLRKAWVGDWKQKFGKHCSVISDTDKGLDVIGSFDIGRSMTFPDRPMAEDFFDSFRDLLEKARKLL